MRNSSPRPVRFGIVLVFAILALTLIVPKVSAQFRPSGIPFLPSKPANRPGSFNPGSGLPVDVWKCSKCGRVISVGNKPEGVARCPTCGTRFQNTAMGQLEDLKNQMGGFHPIFPPPQVALPEGQVPPGMPNFPNRLPGAGMQPPPAMPVNRPNFPGPVARQNNPNALPVLPPVSADVPARAIESSSTTTSDSTPKEASPEPASVSSSKALGRVILIALGIGLVIILVVGGILLWLRTKVPQRTRRPIRTSRR